MLRNIPERYVRNSLTDLLDKEGFEKLYDFVYMPMNFRTKTSFGYTFVNLVSPSAAQRCHDKFQGFSEWGVETTKVCEVSWSNMHQGLQAHIERYRNSPVMHESLPDEYKPVMFNNGVRVVFPPPTKKLRQPRIRRVSDGDGEGSDQFDEDGVVGEEMDLTASMLVGDQVEHQAMEMTGLPLESVPDIGNMEPTALGAVFSA